MCDRRDARSRGLRHCRVRRWKVAAPRSHNPGPRLYQPARASERIPKGRQSGELNSAFAKRNLLFLGMRGNHCDPHLFDGSYALSLLAPFLSSLCAVLHNARYCHSGVLDFITRDFSTFPCLDTSNNPRDFHRSPSVQNRPGHQSAHHACGHI